MIATKIQNRLHQIPQAWRSSSLSLAIAYNLGAELAPHCSAGASPSLPMNLQDRFVSEKLKLPQGKPAGFTISRDMVCGDQPEVSFIQNKWRSNMCALRSIRLIICLLALLTLQIETRAVEKLGPAPDDSFSIVLIPDTQAYKGAGTKSQPDSREQITNKIFQDHTEWIAENIDRQNIVFVSHVGDIVDKNVDEQWEVAQACMNKLHGKIPYGISVGNHDMTSSGDSSLFQKYFPQSRFEHFDWYAGSYAGSPMGKHISGNNANSCQLFSVGDIDFIFLHLECNAPDDVLGWANDLLKRYADRTAFITSHMGWGPRVIPKDNDEYITGEKGRMTWLKIHGKRGNTPQQMWEKCYRLHANLVAVFSGDQSRTQAFQAATVGDHGNMVHEFMQDYGSGWLRMYRFTPLKSRVRGEAITFNPRTEELCEGVSLVPARQGHQFEFEFSRQLQNVATAK